MEANIKQVSRIEYTGPYMIVNTSNFGVNLSAIVPVNDLQSFLDDNERISSMKDGTSCVTIVEYKI